MDGIQDCGIDPIAYKSGKDLVIGDRISVYWRPRGAALLHKLPYKSRMKVFPEGSFIGAFEKAPYDLSNARFTSIVINPEQFYAVMPD
jgi:hypothetical protein